MQKEAEEQEKDFLVPIPSADLAISLSSRSLQYNSSSCFRYFKMVLVIFKHSLHTG